MHALAGSPYDIDPATAPPIDRALARLQERVDGLRAAGRLSPATLRLYYGQTRAQGYDRATALLRQAQARQLAVWNAALELLLGMLDVRLHELVDRAGGHLELVTYKENLTLDDYVTLCRGEAISQSWSFRIRLEIPGLSPLSRLAWIGHRSALIRQALPADAPAAPSIFWSEPNPERFPQWLRLEHGPGGDEMTLVGDRWFVRRDSRCTAMATMELADAIAAELLAAPVQPGAGQISTD